MNKLFQTISGSVCGICGFLWGAPDGLLYALVAFMVIDYVTGLIVAWLRHSISSSIGFIGIARKLLIFLLVAVGHILDVHVLGGGVVCRSAVIGFYLANEGISILENAGNIGLPLPKKLLEVLKQVRDKEDKS